MSEEFDFYSPEEAIESILVTGGAGFIGSNFLHWAVHLFSSIHFTCLDSLSYAGHLENLDGLIGLNNFEFVQMDVRDQEAIEALTSKKNFDWIFHLAAESHVDRSLIHPRIAVETNVVGTFNLLEAFRTNWKGKSGKRFINVSTDEVYGSVLEGKFSPDSRYDPSSPYSATKAAADHLARAYYRSYSMPVIVTNCSNNYGPRQYPEKLIPLTLMKLLRKEMVPIYGDGGQIREWLYVEDHVKGLWLAAKFGLPGETYLFGSGNEVSNLNLVEMICDVVAEKNDLKVDDLRLLISHVKDRPGHDRRYSVDSTKARKDLNWSHKVNVKDGLNMTCEWYCNHLEWLKKVGGSDLFQWQETQYGNR